MRKVLVFVLSFILMTLTGCTVHVTNHIRDQLQPTELYDSYGIKSINLQARSKCALPPTVSIINAETRVEDYVVYTPLWVEWVVNPRELMNGVVDYLKYGFQKSKVQINSNSSKIIRLSMKEVNTYGQINPFIAAAGYFQVEVDIPEIKYKETYEAKDATYAGGLRAIAYAIHVVTRQIIDDPNIQDYILCR